MKKTKLKVKLTAQQEIVVQELTRLKYKSNAEWDEESQDFISDYKYNFEVFHRKITKHFYNGGAATNNVLAGLCEVSHTTVSRWRDRMSRYYKVEFAQLISELQHIATAVLDGWHRESANGERPKANAATLNRRAEKMLNMVPEAKVVQEYTSAEQIQEAIDRVVHDQQKYLGGKTFENSDE